MANRSMYATPAPRAGLGPFGLLSRAIESLRSRRALRAARRSADAELMRTPVPSLRLAWRAAELIVPKRRLELARSLRGLVRDADWRYLPNAAPINRLAVRTAEAELLAMADRLADLETPVSPRGILLLERMLLDGSSPVYDREHSDELLDVIDTTAAALELP